MNPEHPELLLLHEEPPKLPGANGANCREALLWNADVPPPGAIFVNVLVEGWELIKITIFLAPGCPQAPPPAPRHSALNATGKLPTPTTAIKENDIGFDTSSKVPELQP